jgi:hypothetical protein
LCWCRGPYPCWRKSKEEVNKLKTNKQSDVVCFLHTKIFVVICVQTLLREEEEWNFSINGKIQSFCAPSSSQQTQHFLFFFYIELFLSISKIQNSKLQMTETKTHPCWSAGCKNQATQQCPTCIQLKLPPSYFCSQECFKKNWSTHKLIHVDPTTITPESYLDWRPEFRGYRFTGSLRPGRLSAPRTGSCRFLSLVFFCFCFSLSDVVLFQYLSTYRSQIMLFIPEVSLRVKIKYVQVTL